jgi:Putative DNA-binding domain
MPNVDSALIESLLFEEEGTELDFKEEQYKFVGASDDEKSELLKDILAFANAWRRSDAYILLGARDVKGGRSIPIGVSQQLDDAQLQQFVNSKTQRPLTFTYRPIEFEGKPVAVIHIPLQQRPIYLRRAYGHLEPNTVYLRRGSSTDIARPDEVSRMGASQTQTTTGPRVMPRVSGGVPNASQPEEHRVQVFVENVDTPVPRELRVDMEVPSHFSVPDVLDTREGYKLCSTEERWFDRPLFKGDKRLVWDLSFKVPFETPVEDRRLRQTLRVVVNAHDMEPQSLELLLAKALNYPGA